MFEEIRTAYSNGVHEFWRWTEDANATQHDAHEAGLRAVSAVVEGWLAALSKAAE